MTILIIDLIPVRAGARMGPRSDRMVVAGGECVRYAITNLSAIFPGPAARAAGARRARLFSDLHRWAAQGIDFIQLREKSLSPEEVFSLAEAAMGGLRPLAGTGRPRLLINGRPDIAAAAHADGVHLPSRPGELTPRQVRGIFAAAGLPPCQVSVSCHSVPEVVGARGQEANVILFGPVFEKRVGEVVVAEGLGLDLLREACAVAGPVPVLALGGVTAANLPGCVAAGAAGIAGIRQFGVKRGDVPA